MCENLYLTEENKTEGQSANEWQGVPKPDLSKLKLVLRSLRYTTFHVKCGKK